MESCFYLCLLSILILFCQLIIAFSQSFSSSSFIQPRCYDDERSALLKFKGSFNYCNESAVESWKEGGDCCSWDGVSCHKETNHVVSLDLSHSCLYGSLNSNSTLFSLVHLRKLNLSFNDFKLSEIPSEIGLLSRLTHLDLCDSNFHGQIPIQISNLSKLVSLDMSYNELKVHKPGFRRLIQNLIHLKALRLSYVNISSRVPDILANFSSLESLRLYSCELYGEFPVAIFLLPNLQIIHLGKNADLTGYLPHFPQRSPLKSLSLLNTNFGGELSPSIGNLTYLEVLDFYLCNFTGKYPLTFMSNLTELVYLDLSFLQFNHNNPTTSSLSWISGLTKLTTLGLGFLNLNGEIPSSLVNLTQLLVLYLSHNQLTGPIPISLMNLTQLEKIYLRNNQLSGKIPYQINHLSSLTKFFLSSNHLSGSIPTNLSNLHNLLYFLLHSNNLVGPVELDIFSPLKNLISLTLSFNNLSWITRPTSHTSFPNLKILGLASCNISEFPTFLQNQNDLEFLDLSSNNISGKIPSWISKLSTHSLDILNLSHNHLIGFEQDPIVLQWSQLRILDMRYNVLKGSVPLPPSSITFYLISHNQLSGEVSPLICNLTSLIVLDLSFNNLNGELPQCLSNFSDTLSILDLKGNDFHGAIPSKWKDGCNLQVISMSGNRLQGQLPRSIVNCSLLEMVDFGHNNITDSFPSWMGTLPELGILILRFNGLYGVIESFESIGFSNLRVIDLSANNFKGKLPSKFFHMWNAMKVMNTSHMAYMQKSLWPHSYTASTYFGEYDYSMTLYNKGSELNYTKIPDILFAIDFSHNKFEGQIPENIGNLEGLQLLNLSGNNLNGHIPSSLANLKALECLDLSENQLSGEIPSQFTQITSLSSFNVSFNNLSGPIPQGNQFCTFDSKSYEGNPQLNTETWSEKCGHFKSNPSSIPPTFGEDEAEESAFKVNWLIVSLGYLSGLVVGVVAGNEFFRRKYHWFFKGNRGGRKCRKRSTRHRN